ncbi:hypothetical protein B0H14DRAFT_3570349 [Mycena olivaceomarginata]|nr:hypothetical protein B0H14DRAFT_3570349 [Mycena olivaceomarginata]
MQCGGHTPQRNRDRRSVLMLSPLPANNLIFVQGALISLLFRCRADVSLDRNPPIATINPPVGRYAHEVRRIVLVLALISLGNILLTGHFESWAPHVAYVWMGHRHSRMEKKTLDAGQSIPSFIQYPETAQVGLDKPLPPLPIEKDDESAAEQQSISADYIRPPPRAHIPIDIRRSQSLHVMN